MFKLKSFVDIDKISWSMLSLNPHALDLLEKNIDKIDWICLSSNPNAIHLLEKNVDKIDWYNLSRNQIWLRPNFLLYSRIPRTGRCVRGCY